MTMLLQNKYKFKVFAYFSMIFILFAVALTIYQYLREKDYQKEKLELLLNKYTLIIKSGLPKTDLPDSAGFKKIREICTIFPDSTLRITIMDLKGTVLFDTQANNLENHLSRPEIAAARLDHFGSSIRHSATTNEDYFYYALKTPAYYIRAALPFTQQVADFLKVSHLFIYFMLIIFILAIFLLLYATEKVGNSVSRLRDFAVSIIEERPDTENQEFDTSEVGEISDQIKNIYFKMQRAVAELELEKEKLLMHIQSAKEGIGIFSADYKPLVYNKFFIEYLNFISDQQPLTDLTGIFSMPELENIRPILAEGQQKSYSLQIEKSGRILLLELIVFQDRSFEINITDITVAVNEKRFKQEMTSNIAHELKTPVAAVQGFLETILNNPGLSRERLTGFLEKSYNQIKRLADLIGDISIINKLDEAKELFKTEEINIKTLVMEIIYDFELRMQESHIDYHINLDNVKVIRGNIFLLDAIFRNLIDNAIKYGGKFTDIRVTCSDFDEHYYYFSIKDTGHGVPEEDLPRIFERFYRVDKGRSRSLGGTGLGLSIVKNAVEFHHGNILVKSHPGKGTEFTFSIARDLF